MKKILWPAVALWISFSVFSPEILTAQSQTQESVEKITQQKPKTEEEKINYFLNEIENGNSINVQTPESSCTIKKEWNMYTIKMKYYIQEAQNFQMTIWWEDLPKVIAIILEKFDCSTIRQDLKNIKKNDGISI